VAGDTSIDELLELLELDENAIQTSCTTVGGWVTDIMEHIPEAGETAEYGIFRILVTAVNEQTIEKLQIKKEVPPETSEEDA
jgi:CBS domain containing-hemolysin-like protein